MHHTLAYPALVLASVLSLSMPASASTALALRIYTTGAATDIMDNGSGDLDPVAGRIRLSGPLGGYDMAEVLVRSGIGGSTGGPFLNVTGVFENLSVADPALLGFQVVQQGFVFAPPGLSPGSTFDLKALTAIRGITDGELVTVITNVDRSNTGFETVGVYPDQVVANETYVPSGSIALSIADDIARDFAFAYAAPFSLRTWIEVDHGAAGDRTQLLVGNAVVPLPAPVLLLGSALATLLVGAARRRPARSPA